MQAGNIGESTLYRFDMTYDYGHEQVWIDPTTDIEKRSFNRGGLRLRKVASGEFLVSLVVPNSPAAAAGLVVEDRVLSVGGRPATSLAWADVVVMLTGPIGAEVPLSVVSNSGGDAHDVTLRLAEILP
jgi:C-terminal processing protease CtpA/Prc